MLQNLTNFFNLIKTRKIKTSLLPNDLIAVGTRDNTWEGKYQPTAITYADLAAQIGGGTGGTYTYEIGQYVPEQGGVICHRWLSTIAEGIPTSGTVQNYLVIDTNDLSVSAEWATLEVNISNVESFWNGSLNTTNIIAAGAGSGITAGTAAVLCNNSTNNSQTDWYLPAIDELSKIWQNRWEVLQGINFAGGGSTGLSNFGQQYWSSTELDNKFVWSFNFKTGTSDSNVNNKSSTLYVRAVRTFSI